MGQWAGTVAIATAASAAFQSGGFGFLTDVLGASAGASGGRGLGNALAGMLGAGPGDVSVSMPSSVAKGSGQPAKGAGAKGQRGAPGGAVGGGHGSNWEAARAALRVCNPESIASVDPNNPLSSGLEWGGLIYELNGQFWYTRAVVGTEEGSVDPWDALQYVPEAARGRGVGDYHTHGGKGPFPGERFSGDPGDPDGVSLATYSRTMQRQGDYLESLLDLDEHKADILNRQGYRSYLGTPEGRFGVYSPAEGWVFYFDPSTQLLPPGSDVPAATYSWH